MGSIPAWPFVTQSYSNTWPFAYVCHISNNWQLRITSTKSNISSVLLWCWVDYRSCLLWNITGYLIMSSFASISTWQIRFLKCYSWKCLVCLIHSLSVYFNLHCKTWDSFTLISSRCLVYVLPLGTLVNLAFQSTYGAALRSKSRLSMRGPERENGGVGSPDLPKSMSTVPIARSSAVSLV